MRNRFARAVAAVALTAGFMLSGPGCGILFHPERGRSASNSGQLAVGSVLLDCCWLFVGLVPGVVALVIDFSSGGAYLQYPEAYYDGHPHVFMQGENGNLVEVDSKNVVRPAA